MMKRLKVCLHRFHIDKLKSILIEQGRNPNKKRATLIREIIRDVDLNKMYVADHDFQKLMSEFQTLNESGKKLNELMYNLNIEHLNHSKGKECNYVLNADEFAPVLKDLKNDIERLKEEVKSMAKLKKVI